MTGRTRLLLIDVLIKLQRYERALNEIEIFETLLRPSSVDITIQGKSGQATDSKAASTKTIDTKV